MVTAAAVTGFRYLAQQSPSAAAVRGAHTYLGRYLPTYLLKREIGPCVKIGSCLCMYERGEDLLSSSLLPGVADEAQPKAKTAAARGFPHHDPGHEALRPAQKLMSSPDEQNLQLFTTSSHTKPALRALVPSREGVVELLMSPAILQALPTRRPLSAA
ncbi:hypothetical protein XA68_12078 [Ophiocordyceps unilateralis]|uniref:Uncharacterized protein n=1 Tax=Ophiocordyceps unilateralis TaxID=268505 RepID=A0A2A9PFF1_OPHUN|nr:hypothetical protein XA68_12078 [Ophiocordyceps unilateralis]